MLFSPLSLLSENINASKPLDPQVEEVGKYILNSTMHCSARFLHHNLIIPPKLPHLPAPSSASPPITNSTAILRRNLTSSSLLLLLLTPLQSTAATTTCTQPSPTTQAFLDISIDGKPIGRIIIGLYTDAVPAGSATFSSLVTGRAGVSYRRKEFVKIMPNYVQHGGLRSYGVDVELAKKTGRGLEVDNLVSEWEKQNESCGGTKNVAKSVSIIVRDPLKPPPKMKLVARGGKLKIEEEEMGRDPNGTEFVIVGKDSPELDAAALVVGEVVEGMDVVDRIEQVKTVQENSTSPYFRVAKLIGDKRAVVAERGFNRPYSKVVVTNCGLIE